MEKELYGWGKPAEQGQLMLEEEKKFFQLQYRKTLNMKFELETLGETMKKVKEVHTNLRQQLKVKLAKEHNNGYLFITVNPKWSANKQPNMDEIKSFEKQLIKFINRNFIDEAWAVLEQRGETDAQAGIGCHAHIELKRNLNYRPSDIIKGVKNTFKKFCDVNNPNLLTCQTHGEDYHKDKMEYIEGVKTGEGKDIKQEVDKTFRKKYNLSTIYKICQQEKTSQRDSQVLKVNADQKSNTQVAKPKIS